MQITFELPRSGGQWPCYCCLIWDVLEPGAPLSAAGWRCTAAALPTGVAWDALAGYAEYGITRGSVVMCTLN